MVIVNAYAFDKNSSAMYGYQIRSESKEDFNAQMKEFEDGIPFSRYYTELTAQSPLLDEVDFEIVSDYNVELFD